VPRIVRIWHRFEEGFYSDTPLPAALATCKDSRHYTLRYYPLCFGTPFYSGITRCSYELDTLFIHKDFNDSIIHLFDAGIPTGLKYLAIDVRLHYEFLHKAGYRKAISNMGGLKEVWVLDPRNNRSHSCEAMFQHQIEVSLLEDLERIDMKYDLGQTVPHTFQHHY